MKIYKIRLKIRLSNLMEFEKVVQKKRKRGEVIEFLMLKLRNKIASKEFEISLANKELQSAGGWLYAHDLSVNEINAAIDFLIKQIEEIEGE